MKSTFILAVVWLSMITTMDASAASYKYEFGPYEIGYEWTTGSYSDFGDVTGSLIASDSNGDGEVSLDEVTAFDMYYTNPDEGLDLHFGLADIVVTDDEFYKFRMTFPNDDPSEAPTLDNTRFLANASDGSDYQLLFWYFPHIQIAGDAFRQALCAEDIQVSAVPVPPSIALFGTALLGLFGINRRRKAKLS